MKIVGILLVIAFLIMPAAAARPFATTPEGMVAVAGVIAVLGVIGGLAASNSADLPGGPSIVMVLSVISVAAPGQVFDVERELKPEERPPVEVSALLHRYEAKPLTLNEFIKTVVI